MLVEKTVLTEPMFEKKIEQYFGLPIEKRDFVQNSEIIRKDVNREIAEITDDMIPELIPKGMVEPEATFVHFNALLFKAKWFYSFSQTDSYEGKFYAKSTESQKTLYMKNKAYYRIGKVKSLNAALITIPYQPIAGEVFALTIIKPLDLQRNIDDFTRTFSSFKRLPVLLKNIDKRNPKQIYLHLPKWKQDKKTMLKKSLIAMGITDIFENRANFSPLLDPKNTKPIKTSELIHQAVLEVDEKGSKAAAASAFVGGIGGPGKPLVVPHFHVDRSFVYLLRHLKSQQILMMGKVSNPGF